ncbi:MAG: DUF2330 domain-containing protein [Candidatus Krumholzibacteriia bacterium]
MLRLLGSIRGQRASGAGPRLTAAPAAVFAAAVLLSSLLAAPAAPADGCFVWRNERIDIREPEQKAVILFEAGWEDLILEVRYEGAPEEFGWIVPLPAEPELEPSSPDLFVRLSELTQEPRYGGAPGRHAAGLHAGVEAVEVLQRKRVGIYDAAVLAARSGRALEAWLAGNGFRPPAGAGPLLAEYARRGWTFTAMKIAADAADTATARRLGDGTIQPVRFRFRTEAPVFPLKISAANGGDADLLLYVLTPTALEPANCRGVRWQVSAYGPFAPWNEWKAGFLPAHATLARGEGFLTKLRARFRPEQMEDLAFRPYDAEGRLRSDSLAVRAEAASQLGWSGARAGARPLLAFLKRARGAGQDVWSALWALGRVGDRAAIPTLLVWARGDDARCRLEAIEALAALQAPDLTAVSLAEVRRVFPRWLMSEEDHLARVVRDSSLARLVAAGDPACVAGLRDIVDPAAGWGLREAFGVELEERQCCAVAVMAACGDREAFAAMRRAVVTGGAEASRRFVKGTGVISGGVRDFPDALWGDFVDRGREARPAWPAARNAHGMLAARPALRDSLYRQASADPALPDAARTVLLSLLADPRPGDIAMLREIWTRAVRSGLEQVVRITSDASDRDGTLVPCNLVASCAACALGRLDRSRDLLDLLRELPAARQYLRAELCRGLALTRSSLGAAAVADYVREAWNATASAPGFREGLHAPGERDRRPLLTRGEWGFDLPYREADIARYLSGAGADTTVLEGLVADRGLDPYLRLYWFRLFPIGGAGFVSARARVLAVKDELSTALGDPTAEAELQRSHSRLWYVSDHALRLQRAVHSLDR